MARDSGMLDYMRRSRQARRNEAIFYLVALLVTAGVAGWAVFAP